MLLRCAQTLLSAVCCQHVSCMLSALTARFLCPISLRSAYLRPCTWRRISSTSRTVLGLMMHTSTACRGAWLCRPHLLGRLPDSKRGIFFDASAPLPGCWLIL